MSSLINSSFVIIKIVNDQHLFLKQVKNSKFHFDGKDKSNILLPHKILTCLIKINMSY